MKVTNRLRRHPNTARRRARRGIFECHVCRRQDVRLYRSYGECLRYERIVCNAHLQEKRKHWGWCVPLVFSSQGDVWGYTSCPEYDIERSWKSKPDALIPGPVWTAHGWYDSREEPETKFTVELVWSGDWSRAIRQGENEGKFSEQKARFYYRAACSNVQEGYTVDGVSAYQIEEIRLVQLKLHSSCSAFPVEVAREVIDSWKPCTTSDYSATFSSA
jgi:hypothetical protein